MKQRSQKRWGSSDAGRGIRRTIIAVLMVSMISLGLPLTAGDKAEFLNLGFSSDGSTFFYGQHGIDVISNDVYVTILGFDLESESLDPELAYHQTVTTRAIPGQQSSLAALIRSVRVYEDETGVTLDPMRTGRILYYVLPGSTAEDVVTFVDHRDSMIYDVALTERPLSTAPGDSAAVNVTAYITPLTEETTSRFDSGSLAVFEDAVYDYLLKQIIISPDDRYLVCVFQTRVFDENSGTSIRYSLRRVALEPQP